MTVLTAVLSIVVFMLCLKWFGVVKVSHGVLATSRDAVGAMRNQKLDDDEREKIVRKASIQLLAQFFSIFTRVVAVLVASFIPIWAISLTGVTTVDAVFGFLARWDVILVITVVMIAAYFAWVRWSKK